MGNFRAYPGMWLRATEDHSDEIKKGAEVQLLSAPSSGFSVKVFTFVGKVLNYPVSGKGWEPIKYDNKTEV